jgi:PAS domain S-box-containing protein
MKGLRKFAWRPTTLRYGAAVGSVALALLARMAVGPQLDDQLPFAAFFAGIAAAAWLGGVGPAILSAALGFALAELFFVPHGHAWWILTPLDLAIAASYLVVASTIVILTWALNNARVYAIARQMELQREIGQRIQAEEALRKAYNELESRVRQRTAELDRAVTALEHEKRRFHKVLEFLPVCAALLTPDHHVSFANRMFRERFGEAHGRHCFETSFGLNAPCEFCGNYRVLETMAPHEWECAGPDGRAYQVFAFPYRDTEQSSLILAVKIDITEVKRALATVSEQAALLQLARDAIIVTELDGKISFWNRGAEEIYGWRPEEAVGKNAHELLQTTFPIPLDDIRSLIRDQGQWDGELTQVTRDGQTVIVASLWSMRKDDEGKPSAVLEINRDIRDRKRVEEALIQQTRELQRSNAELQQFAYVASHDLQEPLRIVANFTQLLAERYASQLDVDAREFMAFAVGGAVRMQALIQGLLSYARVGAHAGSFEPVDCNEALARAEWNLQASIVENGALVSHEDLPVISADATQLVQLFQNLIGNAIKFKGANPPRVHVSAVRRADDWVFSVRDNGIGIAPQYAERIFGIFQRLHRPEEYPGTGIGLAICKKIVERHGGKIGIESEPGNGSRFFFSIPAAGKKAGVASGEVGVKRHE